MEKRDYQSYNILGEELAQELEQTTLEDVYDLTSETKEIADSDQVKDHNVQLEKINLLKKTDQTNELETEKMGGNENKEEVIEEKKTTAKKESENVQSDKEIHFPAYKRYYQQKERSTLFKWIMALAKATIVVMLLPLICVIAFASLCVIGAFLGAIALSIGIGIVVLGSICFMSTQISGSLIGLGIAVSITALSFGGMVLIIFLAILKWIVSFIKKYKRPRNVVRSREGK